ncbi:MAG: helix-turn-helix domain-containing protein [Propionibacteriales bacterium]|nr:helix-turn-helix domain-containing protein [Propionibacteriales bacterium]
MKPTEARRTGGVQSIDRAASILRCFSERRAELTLSEIARATGLTTSTTHRLLAAMQQNHLLRQTQGRRYAPGPLLVQLVRAGAVTTTLREAAMPVMTDLRDQVEETVGLHALTPNDERVVIDQAESHQPLRRTYTDLGLPIPLPYGAPGKVLCAWLPPARREAILGREIVPMTPMTMTDPAALRTHLEEVRSRGFAMSFAERTPGIRSVAAPLFDHDGAVTGCMSVSGPELRMPAERMQDLGAHVRQAAWTVSEALGATPDVVRTRTQSLGLVGQ